MKYTNCDFYVLIFCGLTLRLAFTYDDLSNTKFASQSTSWDGPNYDASFAVDRNTATCMRTREIGINSPVKTMWWKVDLGGVYSIYSINVLFKNYGIENDYRQRGRFAGFSLYVSTTGDIQGSTLCYKDGPKLPPLNFTTTCTEYGRYVIFYNERLDRVTYPKEYEIRNVFTEICEVIVQGCCKIGVYGNTCNQLCPINCKYNTCHIEHGTCINCKPGWTGIFCNEKCELGWRGINCSQQCVGHCIDGASCNHITGNCDRGCDAGWTGSMCDKECDDGTYGYSCINNCSGHCLNGSPCNKHTGYCDKGCNPGHTDRDCSRECTKSYGENCKFQCSIHCIDRSCDRFDGSCSIGCKEGKECNTAEYLHTAETRSNVSPWIVAFSITLVTSIIFISTTFILLWRFILKRKLLCDDKQSRWRSTSNQDRTIIRDEASHYQDLNVSKEENTYQTLEHQ